jgi:hypothetical protein
MSATNLCPPWIGKDREAAGPQAVPMCVVSLDFFATLMWFPFIVVTCIIGMTIKMPSPNASLDRAWYCKATHLAPSSFCWQIKLDETHSENVFEQRDIPHNFWLSCLPSQEGGGDEDG